VSSLGREISCHCGATFTEWSTLKDFSDSSIYRICPSCYCQHQKLTHDKEGNPSWVSLPEDLLRCPKIGYARKTYSFILQLLNETRDLGRPRQVEDNEDFIPKEIRDLLKQGWRMRKKRIKGRFYAYLQRGKVYRYVGVWKQEYDERID